MAGQEERLQLQEAVQVAYDQISDIIEGAFRASSAVKCMNRVLRMQQSPPDDPTHS
jgi:hypothetical protein